MTNRSVTFGCFTRKLKWIMENTRKFRIWFSFPINLIIYQSLAKMILVICQLTIKAFVKRHVIIGNEVYGKIMEHHFKYLHSFVIIFNLKFYRSSRIWKEGIVLISNFTWVWIRHFQTWIKSFYYDKLKRNFIFKLEACIFR